MKPLFPLVPMLSVGMHTLTSNKQYNSSNKQHFVCIPTEDGGNESNIKTHLENTK